MDNQDRRGRIRPRTKIAGQFIAHPKQLVESASMRVLSLAERRALDRIEIEHMGHGGAENGKLPVTYIDFEKWGVRPDSIAGALRVLEALGLIEITRHGYAGAAAKRAPNLYRLTYVGAYDAGKTDATGTHEYQRIKSVEDAKYLATQARSAPDARNSARAKIYFTTPQNVAVPPHKLRGETDKFRPAN
jgi:hypothetical protein